MRKLCTWPGLTTRQPSSNPNKKETACNMKKGGHAYGNSVAGNESSTTNTA